jgi:hypothetical protein
MVLSMTPTASAQVPAMPMSTACSSACQAVGRDQRGGAHCEATSAARLPSMV